ncbi:O-antigen polymerase [Massilimicrobiota sp. An80]|uniref:O-antigen polymerase n=1 Tax=Massilimicrobiota sp. An80 TaxID=1965658 RepID=UPI000B43A91D|nr:O-antigen polymerase [Massilimicrobiota sp. An80]OUN37273.1 hypothetical protein B5G32_04705 [Massilimicrobiota sp. An80]
MNILLCSLVLVVFTLVGIYQYNRLLNPITGFISFQLLLILLGLCSPAFETDYSVEFFMILMTSYIMFWIGTLGGKNLIFKIRKTSSVEGEYSYNKLVKAVRIIAVITNISIVFYLIDILGNFGLSYIISNMSEYNQILQEGYYSGKLYYTLTFLALPESVFVLILLLEKKTKHRFLLFVQFIICFIPFISVRRDTLFKAILLNLLTYYYVQISNGRKGKNRKTKGGLLKIGVIIAGTTGFMSVTQNMLNKSYSIQNFAVAGFKIPDFLSSPLTYFIGSFPYFNKLIETNIKFLGVGISTFRIPLLYLQGLWGGKLNLSTPFSLDFLNIGTQSYIAFNTAPIQYYSLIEFGLLFPLFYLVLGYISSRMYYKFNNNMNIRNTVALVMIQSILIWGIREYTLIYLTTWITIITMIIVCIYIKEPKKE